MTTREVVEFALLKGMKITKFDLLNMAHSVCLAQRIQEIRNAGWDVKSRTVKGKGTLVEYWLEPCEIERIKGWKRVDEQSLTEEPNHAENGLKTAQIEEEQVSLGLFGEYGI